MTILNISLRGEHMFNKNTKFRIDPKNLTANSETMSVVSMISYEIEKAKFYGVSDREILAQFDEINDEHRFPNNIEYLNSYQF